MDIKPERMWKNVFSFTRYLLTLGLFVAAAVFALILARGNTFTEEGISQTGTIRLNTENPDNLVVFVDEQVTQLTNNKTVEGLLPGEYMVRIEKDGFSSWEQQVEIFKGLITDLDFQLFPEELQLNSLDTKSISQLFFSPDRSILFYSVVDSQIGANIGIWQRNLQTGSFAFNQQSQSDTKITNSVLSIRSAFNSASLELLPSLDNRRILLSNGQDYFILDSDIYNEPDVETKLEINYPIDSIQWLRDSTNLLIESGLNLIDFDITQQTSTLVAFDGETSPIYTVTNGVVYYSEAGNLMKYTSGTTEPVKLLNTQIPTDINSLHTAKNNLQNIVLETKSGLYFLNIEQSFVNKLGDYTFISFAPNAESVFVRDELGQILSVDILISRLRDTVKVSTAATQLPTDLLVDSISWANNSAFIVFFTESQPNVVHTADRLGNNVTEILDSEDSDIVTYSLLPNSAGMVMVLEDASKSTLYQLDFTE